MKQRNRIFPTWEDTLNLLQICWVMSYTTINNQFYDKASRPRQKRQKWRKNPISIWTNANGSTLQL